MSSGGYVIGSSVPIAVTDPAAGAVESHWLRSLSSNCFSNGTMRGTIRPNTDGTPLGYLLSFRGPVGGFW